MWRHLLQLAQMTVCAAVLIPASRAAISISVDAERLLTASGSDMPTSGLLLLVVSTQDGSFAPPTATEFVPASSDDRILYAWDLADGGNAVGVFSGLASNILYGPGFDAGDPIALYWFPDATKASSQPGSSARYGFFRDTTGVSGTSWTLPEDGALLHSLKFFTGGSSKLSAPGSIPNYASYASLPIGASLATLIAPGKINVSIGTGGTVQVRWSDLANNETGYIVDRTGNGGSTWESVGIVAPDQTQFDDHTAKVGETYVYRVTAVNSVARSFSSTSSAIVSSKPRLLNLSTRALAQTGDNILIPGFVVGGTGTKRLLIRAVGPTLGAFGLTDTLSNPRITLKGRGPSGFVDLFSNDDWATNANADAITQTAVDLGAFPFSDSREAALLVDLAPGEYTVLADGVDTSTGVAIVELYDADPKNPSARLINISNRGFVGVGEQIMIPGLVIEGPTPKTVLIRGIGPGLDAFLPPASTLDDPILALYSGQTQVNGNDNWGSDGDTASIVAAQTLTGAFPLSSGSKDAVLLVTLPPGAYTVQCSGVGGTTGVVIVEVYEVP